MHPSRIKNESFRNLAMFLKQGAINKQPKTD